MKRIDGLLALLRGNLPRAVKSAGNFEDWNVVAPALVAIGGQLFESIVSAVPPSGRVRAEILARSLAEYAIGFAYLAAPEDEQERAHRVQQLVKDEFLQRERAENQVADQIGKRAGYQKLFAPDRPGPLPHNLLNDQTRAVLDELKADSSLGRLPNAFEMAFKADERWMPEIDLVAHNPFALIYFTLFTGPSHMVHPSVWAVSRMVVGRPPDLVVGTPEALGVSEMPYGQSLLTLVNMLLVSSRVLGWPEEAAIREVLNRT